MNRSRTNQLLGLGLNIISITMAVLVGHCLWMDTWKEYDSHLTTSALNAEKKMLSTFIVNAYVLQAAYMVYWLSDAYQLKGAIVH